MARFEFVSKYADCGLALPERKTAQSAGYDLTIVEDVIIPPLDVLSSEIAAHVGIFNINDPVTLDEMAKITKTTGAKPVLASTGVKCYLNPDEYLELSVRSSTPLKYWLMCANGIGIIDADYRDNSDNEGEIFLQLINLSPIPIILKKGDIIGQGIIKKYLTTENDAATGARLGGFGSTSV